MLLEVTDSKTRFQYLTSVSFSYFIAFLFQFFANKFCTFRDESKLNYNQVIRYVILIIINYVLTIVSVSIGVEIFLMSPYMGV